MNELNIPPEALKDKDAFELLRVWAAFEEQHVIINSGLSGGPKAFGFLLAELALHGSKLYGQRLEKDELETLKEILDGFNNEIIKESGNPSGSIEE
ncbi:DUF5076 domain-containing protein [Mucilaginibacter gotjawali]|uniref:Uncharacterized protein n=2 Tax=Mucilaginibacter gotjawali TaxID=1550579 RepID=A0A110B6F5_9SPHI|nr:DUF5076 domain-containing protein [Mucilaginibacter gotjawali]MBB3056838.1 N-methylhydantoinase A/oxoprolinase/acetone carboxylase beta subunit [Mucilaginibacter gotjawali]BAU55918.1 hypothetical protein MgSA37_04110 [Mucilaginibacter gotjawali]